MTYVYMTLQNEIILVFFINSPKSVLSCFLLNIKSTFFIIRLFIIKSIE